MPEFSKEVVEDVIRTYRQTRNSPFKTARMCGVSVPDVFAIVDQNQGMLDAAQERFGGLGRPELQEFTVARRKATEREWDNNLPEIAAARFAYENGTHEMATGRDGQWLILYLIPRKHRAKGREGYFLPEQTA